jgi:hypothetical protein
VRRALAAALVFIWWLGCGTLAPSPEPDDVGEAGADGADDADGAEGGATDAPSADAAFSCDARQSPTSFCADFDHVSTAVEGWTDEFPADPGIALVLDDNALSPPHSLRVHVDPFDAGCTYLRLEKSFDQNTPYTHVHLELAFRFGDAPGTPTASATLLQLSLGDPATGVTLYLTLGAQPQLHEQYRPDGGSPTDFLDTLSVVSAAEWHELTLDLDVKSRQLTLSGLGDRQLTLRQVVAGAHATLAVGLSCSDAEDAGPFDVRFDDVLLSFQ